jgi:hypothetical protein
LQLDEVCSGFDAVAYGKAAADLLASKDYKQYRMQLSHEKKAARVTSGPFVPAVSQQTFEDKFVKITLCVACPPALLCHGCGFFSG